MPIVNGIYVNDSLPDAQQAQEQVFGDYSKRDMSDYSAYALNYLSKQQEQAYNLDLWNLMNEYNSPAAQMRRFQDAGLNPNLIYSQSNATSAPNAASAFQGRSAGTAAKGIQNAMAGIGQVMNLVKSARETYDYMTYGIPKSQWDIKRMQEQAESIHRANEWDEILKLGPSSDESTRSWKIGQGPRFSLYKTQSDIKEQEFEKIKFLVSSLLPAQADRQRALTALDDYQLQFMQGKYDAALNLDLGLGETVNQWAKMILFMSMARMF